jgi:hypothetical protein
LTYTAEPLQAKYGTFNDEAIEALQSFPALFVNEKQHNAPGRIGWIAKLRKRDKEVRIEYEFDPNFPPIAMEKLLALDWELDFTDWEMNTTHWVVKGCRFIPSVARSGANKEENGCCGREQNKEYPHQPKTGRLDALVKRLTPRLKTLSERGTEL